MPFISRHRLDELEYIEDRYKEAKKDANDRYMAVYHLAKTLGIWGNYSYPSVEEIVSDILIVRGADEAASNLEESKNRLTPKKTKKKEDK